MVKEDIVEGLKRAVAKGDSLNSAMMSFYNSGYPKEDIEEAAKLVGAPSVFQTPAPQKPLNSPVQQEPPKPQAKSVEPKTAAETSPIPQPLSPLAETQVQQTQQPMQPQTVQKVSKYGGGKPSALGAVAIFILVFFLLVLVGLLIAVFLFKDELATLFNNFIG